MCESKQFQETRHIAFGAHAWFKKAAQGNTKEGLVKGLGCPLGEYSLIWLICCADAGDNPATPVDLSNIPLINPQDAREKQKQTLLTAHSLLAEGGKGMQKADDHGGSKGSAGISLSKALPPILHRLVEKISIKEREYPAQCSIGQTLTHMYVGTLIMCDVATGPVEAYKLPSSSNKMECFSYVHYAEWAIANVKQCIYKKTS